MNDYRLNIAMFSIHSDPIGELGTRDTGGMSVYIRELARELGRRAHCIDIFTRSQEGEDTVISHLYQNVRLIHLGIADGDNLSKLALYPQLPKFYRALENFWHAENLTYDIIHSHYWLSGRLGNWAQSLWHLPHVTTFHTLGKVKDRTGTGEPEPGFRIAAEKQVVSFCHRVLAPTEQERNNLIRFYGALPEKIGVVPCGVDLNHFCPGSKSMARNRLGLDAADTILLYVGRFDPLKGLESLLEAMTYFSQDQRIRLMIVGGDGENTAAYRSLVSKIEKLKIKDRVKFTGRIDQPNLPAYYHAADVLVLPSHYESFGMVALEALACGRPVVSTPVGAIESLIRETQAGRIVADPAPRTLADGIQAILGDRSIPTADSIHKSVQHYSWSKVASAIMQEYECAIQQQLFEDDWWMPAKASC